MTIGMRPDGQLGDGGNVEVAEHRHGDGARNRRRGEHEHVWRGAALAAQRLALLDAEPVLLIDHDESEVVEPTDSLSSAWVPTTMCDWPEIADSSAFLRTDCGSCPVISVGRSSAARSGPRPGRWSAGAARRAPRSGPGARTARRSRRRPASPRSATRVLPEPTSPCSEPVHRHRGGQVGGEFGADRFLVVGSA